MYNDHSQTNGFLAGSAEAKKEILSLINKSY